MGLFSSTMSWFMGGSFPGASVVSSSGSGYLVSPSFISASGYLTNFFHFLILSQNRTVPCRAHHIESCVGVERLLEVLHASFKSLGLLVEGLFAPGGLLGGVVHRVVFVRAWFTVAI